MKVFRFSVLLALFFSGCIHRVPDTGKNDICSRISVPDNLHIISKTRIETGKEKVVLRQHIFVKNGLIRIDTMGLFDDVINTIIVREEKIYVIYYQQQMKYTFVSEESFYNTFGIYIPVSRLPFLLTLSDKTIPGCKGSEDGLTRICGKEKILISKEPSGCKYLKVEFISPDFGDTSAIYSDFSDTNGIFMFHRLKIKKAKDKISLDLSFIRVQIEEINEKIFDPEIFSGFNNVWK